MIEILFYIQWLLIIGAFIVCLDMLRGERISDHKWLNAIEELETDIKKLDGTLSDEARVMLNTIRKIIDNWKEKVKNEK